MREKVWEFHSSGNPRRVLVGLEVALKPENRRRKVSDIARLGGVHEARHHVELVLTAARHLAPRELAPRLKAEAVVVLDQYEGVVLAL